MPLFSVIIPSYNRAGLIAATLVSVFAQEFRDFEVIVVDDGSTDETLERLQPYICRLTLLRQQNRGPGAARNLGATIAQGEYLAFLDSDDLWFPWTLSTYSQIIQSSGRPALIAGAMVHFYDQLELNLVVKQPLSTERYPDYFSAGARGIYCGSGMMVVRRDVFRETGGFLEDPINAEDHDFVLRMGTVPIFINVIAPILIGYRQHQQTATRNIAKAYAGSRRLIEMERTGRYPGGAVRQRDRRLILTQHLRPISLDLLRQGECRKAWGIYRMTFLWNLSLGRIRYLLGFLARALVGQGVPK